MTAARKCYPSDADVELWEKKDSLCKWCGQMLYHLSDVSSVRANRARVFSSLSTVVFTIFFEESSVCSVVDHDMPPLEMSRSSATSRVEPYVNSSPEKSLKLQSTAVIWNVVTSRIFSWTSGFRPH